MLRAVPKGCRLARHVVAWKRAVLEHPALELMRADGRANMAALVEVICRAAGPRLADLAHHLGLGGRDASGVHEDSVGRMIRRLKDWGLLAVVATGRSRPLHPAVHGQERRARPPSTPSPSPHPRSRRPRRPRRRRGGSSGCGYKCRPGPPEGEYVLPRTRAKSFPRRTRLRRDPLPKPPRSGGRSSRPEPADSPAVARHATVRAFDGGGDPVGLEAGLSLGGALELQHHALVLRRITTAYVVSRGQAPLRGRLDHRRCAPRPGLDT